MLIPEAIDKLQNLIKQKVTYQQIGDILGISNQGISNRVQRGVALKDYEWERLLETFTLNADDEPGKSNNVREISKSVILQSKFEPRLRYGEIVEILGKVLNREIKQADLVKATGISRATMSYRESKNTYFPAEDIKAIEKYFNVSLATGEPSEQESVAVIYRPNVALSAGYGLEVYDESAETIMLDKKLFISDRGIMINPAHCEIVTVSGNSMAPEYRNGDRVILDRSYTEFTDGQIFAFRYNGECFIKEICIVGKRIKCIPLNKDYDPFFIEPDEEVTVFGRIIPRIRL